MEKPKSWHGYFYKKQQSKVDKIQRAARKAGKKITESEAVRRAVDAYQA
jgi:hypothetical protein